MNRSRPVSPHPSRLARRLLSRLTRYNEEFAIQGDLAEEFDERVRTSGRVRASFWYRRQACYALASSIALSIQIGVDMFKNVMKIALRTMARFKFYSLINLLGLAVGLPSACWCSCSSAMNSASTISTSGRRTFTGSSLISPITSTRETLCGRVRRPSSARP